jgi:8-oxo-dGTP diphosphatase
MSITYVLGFLFDPGLHNVALIEKQRPEWQRGRFNGIGGKVDVGEDIDAAMSREFHEETGVLLPPHEWTQFVKMTGADGRHFELHVFYAVDATLHDVRTMEAERVVLTSTKAVVQGEFKTIGNIPWLVAMALAVAEGKESCKLFHIEERP